MIKENKNNRLGSEAINNQGCPMKIVEYNNCDDIIAEFQDEYKAKIHTKYGHFISGNVKNPYFPSVYGVGITGNKYPTCTNNKNEHTKEYQAWMNMLIRCFDNKTKEKYPTYKDVTCYDEWLLYENFYEWLHDQPNFDKWLNGKRWAIDKDILIKGNKIYSPETCCLVPMNVNGLFIKSKSNLYGLPIGIDKVRDKFLVRCCNPIINKRERLGYIKH